MKDGFGRNIDYLRISLTDKCNLRCRYCMPEKGVERIAHEEVLRFEEILRICSVLTRLGIKRIRLTGGEPLVRRDAEQLIKSLGELPSKPQLSLTTNGVLLKDRLEELSEAGLKSVNISLDTLKRETFAKLTGTDALEDVLCAVRQALQLGLEVKLNAVPIRGINDAELADLALLVQEEALSIRFIELMPIGCASAYEGVPRDEILERLTERFGAPERAGESGSGSRAAGQGCVTEELRETAEKGDAGENDGAADRGPAEYVRFPGFRGRVGFISPLSHNFCASCNRIRLTADGMLKLCLYHPAGLDVKTLLRSGCPDEELEAAILECVQRKPERHFFTDPAGVQEKRSMYAIGG